MPMTINDAVRLVGWHHPPATHWDLVRFVKRCHEFGVITNCSDLIWWQHYATICTCDQPEHQANHTVCSACADSGR